MNRSLLTPVLSFLFLFLFSNLASAVDDSRKIRADYPVTKLTDRVYVIYGPLDEPNKANQGYRNNIVFVVTKAGVVVMDVGTSVYAGNMALEKIRSVTDKPVVAVFNSHIHGDHWLGNQAFKEANPKVNIYAHANMIQQAKEGEGERWVGVFNAATDNAVVGTRPVIPNIAVKDGDIITIGEVDFRVHDTGPGHSDSDIMIEVLQEKALFAGDNVRANTVAITVTSFKGNLLAIDRILKTDSRIFIPGHGKAGDKTVALKYRKFIDTLRGTVAKHYESGMPDYEMKPIVVNELAEYKHWVRFEEHIGRLVSLAYLEVQDEAFQ